jgi:hypothetical protein
MGMGGEGKWGETPRRGVRLGEVGGRGETGLGKVGG